MPDEPGWMGRAQWMPIQLPGPTPPARLMVALLTALSVLVLAAGWLVAHLTGSVGWGFVTVVSAFLVEMAILLPIGAAVTRRSVAAREADEADE